MSYSMRQLQPVRSRHVIIEYEFEEIIPILQAMLSKYFELGELRIISIEGTKVTLWVKTWAHIKYLSTLSACAEAEALNIQPRPPQDYPFTSK